MVKKLKRFFAMTLAASMFMSQSSVAAFADELQIATSGNASYKISTDSNSESEPVTGSNASLENGIVNIQGKQPMMFGMRGMLPDTVEVTDLSLISVVDGTPEFDEDDKTGHDSSPNNKRVRTLDTVTYNLRISIQEPENPTRNDEDDKVYFKAVLPGIESGEIAFLTDNMKWLSEANVSSTDEGLVLSGYTEVDGVGDAFWQDVSVSMKVMTLDQNDTFEPEFYAWMDGQENVAEASKGTLTKEDTEITVTAKEALNVSIQFDSNTSTGEYKFSENKTVFGTKGSLAVRLEMLSAEEKELKGVKLPDGELSFEITLDIYDNTAQEPLKITDMYMPLLWDYSLLKQDENVVGVLICNDLLSRVS